MFKSDLLELNNGCRFSIMASGGPMMNGDISRSPGQSGTLEETVQQMNNLIQENRDLKGERMGLLKLSLDKGL